MKTRNETIKTLILTDEFKLFFQPLLYYGCSFDNIATGNIDHANYKLPLLVLPVDCYQCHLQFKKKIRKD